MVHINDMIINSNDSPQANIQWWVKCSVSPSAESELFVSSSVSLYLGFSVLCYGTLMPLSDLHWVLFLFMLNLRALLLES